MPTLTDTAAFSKKASKWVVLGLAFLLVFIIFLILGRSIKISLTPAKLQPATVAFGKLPRFDLSIGEKPPANVSYKLETVSGELPQLPTFAKVFTIADFESSFGDLERTKAKALRIGFTQEPVEVSLGIAKFVDPQREDKVLKIETASENFILNSNYLNNPEILTKRAGSVDSAKSAASVFFKEFDLDIGAFPEKDIETRKLKIETGGLRETLALSDANLIEVIFRRSDFDKLPVLSAQAEKPQVWALVSQGKIVAASLNIANIQKFKFATYPLKDIRKAFEDLQAQRAAFNKKMPEGEIVIKEITLGYIESEKENHFLQPVYLFRGSDNLTIYVGALDDLWIE